MKVVKTKRDEVVTGDPRFLYAYSPENTAADTRYKFVAGEKTEERSIRTLTAAYEWVCDNPPTDADWENAARIGNRREGGN